MTMPSSIAVFCGSKPGHDPAQMEAAQALGRGMATRGIRLVYGGGRVGLMGAVADAVQKAGGKVTGVIPEFLMKREVGNSNVDELEVTDSMHSRKRRMFELSDAFVSLAGGLGTLDETVEIITWKQLHLHSKPIVIISVDGYWDFMKSATQDFMDAGFAYASDADLFEIVPSVDAAFDALEKAAPDAGGGQEHRL
ncbi:MAG: TIGR00730 family Rossman fold protein [Rhodospirillales bacterium]|nr:TIGR00730 family Rossman fold protein [Rhodospirillales bacterium]MBO6786097.1 TIGR00730 family Rossman fold protein [Rhodospirillales bacterium]